MHVSCKVRNVGPVTGSEVVQVYVSLPPNGTTNPPMQLRGFDKARDLASGSTTTVNVVLDKYAISYWDESIDEWRISGSE